MDTRDELRILEEGIEKIIFKAKEKFFSLLTEKG